MMDDTRALRVSAPPQPAHDGAACVGRALAGMPWGIRDGAVDGIDR